MGFRYFPLHEWVVASPLGSWIVLLTGLLFVGGILLFFLTNYFQFRLFLWASFLPMLLGVVGMLQGYMAVNNMHRYVNAPIDQELVEEAHREARFPLYLGLTGSCLILFVTKIGLTYKSRSSAHPLSSADEGTHRPGG